VALHLPEVAGLGEAQKLGENRGLMPGEVPLPIIIAADCIESREMMPAALVHECLLL
jgi:hypothetical protein